MRDGPDIVVFSDLDGTLLDHRTYLYDAAQPALTRLRDSGIPLVLVTSKTAAEVAPLRAHMGFAHCPAIVENGGGVLEPFVERPVEHRSHDRLLEDLASLPPELRGRFVGFSDMDAEDICRHTGLSLAAAQRAARRDFSEPGLWQGNTAGRRAFLQALAAKGMVAHQGGRFLTLSYGGDKGTRMLEIASRYRHNGLLTIALGDAPNDAAMIAAADYGVIVHNPEHAGPGPVEGEAEARVVRTGLAGPAGWNKAVIGLLDRLQTSGED